METNSRRCDKAGRADAHRTEKLRIAAGAFVPVRIQRENFVYWFERRNKGVFLTATPIDVSQILRTAVRTVRHSHTDFRNADGGRAI